MQNRRHLVVLILFILLVGPFGDSIAKGGNTSNLAHELMQGFFEASDAPGLTVTVGLNGKIVWSQGFGYADLEQMVPVNPAMTKFRFGSVIKPMTAYAAAQLVDAGRLDLDVPVQTYVPDFPQKRWPITSRQLLAHLAGIRHYENDEFFNRENYASVTAGLVIFENDPLIHMPGAAYSYTSYGYNLIGAVIEGASGQDYLEYMSAHVFKPIEMNNTFPDYLEQIIPGRGRYYYQKDGKTRNTPEVNNSYKWASGGYIGTSDDLVRFGLAQLDNKFISDATRNVFWSKQARSDGKLIEYGLGWRITTDGKGRQWIGHGGGSVGGSTQFWIRKEQGLVIAMISNMSQLNYEEILIELGELFVPE